MAVLKLVPPTGSAIEIGEEGSLVGRDPACGVVLADGSVSRKHAQISRRAGAWFVVDQGSANGTFLDSRRVAESALKSGQEIRFGAATFKLEIEGSDLSATIAGGPAETVVHETPLSPPPPPPRTPSTSPLPVYQPRPAGPPSAPPSAPPPPPGLKLPGPPGRTAPPLPAAGPKKSRGPVAWIVGGCCGCLLLLLIGGGLVASIAWKMTQAPVAATNAMLADLKANRIAEAYARTSSGFRVRNSQPEFEAFVMAHAALRDNANLTVFQRSIDNDVATLTGATLVSSSGERETATFRLVKEEGEWRVDAIEFAASSSRLVEPPAPQAAAA
jgi:predicted component of type VI protein secretion system